MLSAAENELLTRVGPGTPMGELMRCYWIPALASRELAADGEPIRLMLLGEKLIAFRDTNGKIGIMDHECPHRLASLFYGRNEEGGIRCIYHGWKFDVDGNCLDMANVPPHQDFKANVKAPAYQVRERNGVVWAYMGKGEAPPLPNILANLLPEDQVSIRLTQADCNWFQVLEGGIDTSHAAFLHGGKFNLDDFEPGDPERMTFADKTPEYEMADTEWGTIYGAIRHAGPGKKYWRIGHFVFPFYDMPGAKPFETRSGMTARVPMDDEHTMVFQISENFKTLSRRLINMQPPVDPATAYLPNSTDWYGRFRLSINRSNDHRIDREMQRTKNYSGILGVMQQDQAIQESMGPIENRTKEHLASSDRMVMLTRRRLIDAAKRLRDEGVAPPIVHQPDIYFKIENGYFVTSADKDLWAAYQEAYDALQAVSPRAAE